jgi:transposase
MSMDFTAELAQFNPDPALLALLKNRFLSLTEQAQKSSQQAQHNADLLRLANLKNAALILELAHLKRLRFARTSEAFSADQLHLFEESLDADCSAIEAQVALQSPAPKQRSRAGRQPLPEHLPRIIHRHEPESCQCAECGAALTEIGADVSEQLDVEPAKFFVHRHIRPQYACRTCETVTAAAIPPAVIDGGLAAPGLLAWVATQKFLDHLPLYRVEQICARQGVPIARSTLAEWVGRIGVALQPLSERLAELLKQRSILHADETPVPQLDPGKGKTHRAYLWAYRSCDLDHGPPILVFDYQPGRSGQHVRHFLQGWRGHLMVDDYSGYKALFHAGVTELACLAHARRKFFDLHAANQNPFAAEALQRITALYRIEQDAKECSVAQRKALRQSASQPLLDALHDWLLQARRKTADGSGLARAIDYSLRRWPALQRYATQGEFPIDNNPIENAIRPIAIGKKNWLFAGSERAGMRAAAIQSLLGTAKLNGIEPTAWLKETLEKLPTWPNSRIDELLPLRRDTTI